MSINIEDIKEEYVGAEMLYDGNENTFPFVGTCVGVKLDTDDTILLQIKDLDGDVFDIELSDEGLSKTKEEI